MIYVLEYQDNSPTIIYDEELLTPELKAKAVAVEELPETLPPKEGKSVVMKVSKKREEIWYEYIDRTPNESELEIRLNEQQLVIDNLMLSVIPSLMQQGGA